MTKKTTTDYSDLIARLEHRAELEEELAAVKAVLSDATVKRDAALNRILPVREKIQSYETDPDRYGSLLKQAQDDLAELHKEHEALKRKVEDLTGRRAEIEQELSEGAKEGTTVEVVQAHFKAVEEARAYVSQLDALIAEGQGKMQDAKEMDSPMTVLDLERQELLADIAMGKAEESDLEAWEALSAEKQSEIDHEVALREQIVDRISSMLAGLQRRAAEAAAEVERLEARTPQILGRFLLTRAAHVAGEYMELAAKAGDTLKRLVALEQLTGRKIPQAGGFFVPSNAHQLFLPALRLGADTGKLSANPEPLLAYADLQMGDPAATALAEEVARLQAEGVPGL